MSVGKYNILDEVFSTTARNGKRVLKEKTLEEVLDAIAECNGGYSICRGGLILIDTVTGVKNLITLDNGTLVDTPITD